MDSTIVAALLGGVVSIVTTAIGVAATVHLKEKDIRLAQAERDVARRTLAHVERAVLKAGTATANFATTSAFTVGDHTASWQFDEHGVGTLIDRYRGVRATQVIDNLAMPYHNGFMHPDGKTTSVEVKVAPESSLPVMMEEGTFVFTDRFIQGRLVARGLLTPDHGQLAFSVVIPFTNAFCLTAAEAEQAYAQDDWKQDYVGMSVLCPTNILRLQVTFPPSFTDMMVKPHPVVFFARTETVHQSETERLLLATDRFVYAGSVATLTIASPAIGLQYAITWMPPRI